MTLFDVDIRYFETVIESKKLTTDNIKCDNGRGIEFIDVYKHAAEGRHISNWNIARDEKINKYNK